MNKNSFNKKDRSLPEICSFKGNIETYNIVDTIQDSLYGKVYEGYGTRSGKMVAVKVLNKNDIIKKEMNRLLPETPLAEVFFAEEMSNHEYLATIRDVFETEQSHCIISDLADGEDLLELLKKNRYGLEEKKARICMKQAAIALNKCHERGFALQDFSLENCLLYTVESSMENNKDENNDIERKFQIKVCDPGQAVRFGRHEGVEIQVPYLGCIGKKFRPPEIFSGKPYIASKVDSWCLGWSTFYLLFGIELFESVHHIDNDVRWQWYSLGYRDYLYSYLDIKDKLSDNARSFIENLVHPDPMKRMSIKEALEHPFLKDINEKENLLLEKWGRPLTRISGIENMKTSICKSDESLIPCIPEIYKTKYFKLYCTKDKPSGYYPNNTKNNINLNRRKDTNIISNHSNNIIPLIKPLNLSRSKQMNNVNFFQKRVQGQGRNNNWQINNINYQYNYSNMPLNINTYRSNNIQNWPLNVNINNKFHEKNNINMNLYQSLPRIQGKQFFANNSVNNLNSMLFLSCNLEPCKNNNQSLSSINKKPTPLLSVNQKTHNSYVPPALTGRYNNHLGMNNINHMNYRSLSYVPMPNNEINFQIKK